MDQATFKVLLSIYTIYVIYQVVLPSKDPSLSRKEHSEKAVRMFRSLSVARRTIGISLSLTIYALAATGIAGMFFFWPPARWLFLSAVILTVFGQVRWPIQPMKTHTEVIRNEIELFLDGALVVLVFFSPVSQFFNQ
ncbi:hypothetical protein [Pelagicoccus mobilis]|uniref:Uncharacterized protein n=1 Tax=Pelagicoccus mobilis TaxID=415221 RepID=A0A934RZT9_9BACT|nr:hypothetical protein [Pelagicoccus mobilis]MBK1877317.1 hypothetical protein [Pelagicoccus mobilis]